jgi:hypothetical protein
MSSSWITIIHDQNPNSFRMADYSEEERSVPIWPSYPTGGKNGTNFVFRSKFESHSEPDNFRFEAISLLISERSHKATQ